MADKGRNFKKEMKEILSEIYKEKVIDFPVKTRWEFFYKGAYGRDA